MSRAFGNRMLKQFVVAEPEIQVNVETTKNVHSLSYLSFDFMTVHFVVFLVCWCLLNFDIYCTIWTWIFELGIICYVLFSLLFIWKKIQLEVCQIWMECDIYLFIILNLKKYLVADCILPTNSNYRIGLVFKYLNSSIFPYVCSFQIFRPSN